MRIQSLQGKQDSFEETGIMFINCGWHVSEKCVFVRSKYKTVILCCGCHQIKLTKISVKYKK